MGQHVLPFGLRAVRTTMRMGRMRGFSPAGSRWQKDRRTALTATLTNEINMHSLDDAGGKAVIPLKKSTCGISRPAIQTWPSEDRPMNVHSEQPMTACEVPFGVTDPEKIP